MKSLVAKMRALEKTNKFEVSIATSMLAITSDRIFKQGKDADNTPIGNYSKSYLKKRIKSGYPSSRQVILQATRQMVNDFSVISTGSSLGLGFKNQANAEKSEYVESTYSKDIFKHTKSELDSLQGLIDKGIKKALR